MSFSVRILVLAVAALLLTGSVTIACCGMADDESCAMDSATDVESIAGHCANAPSVSVGCDMGQVLTPATGALSAKPSVNPTVLGQSLVPTGAADRSAGERTAGSRLAAYQTTALYALHATLRL